MQYPSLLRLGCIPNRHVSTCRRRPFLRRNKKRAVREDKKNGKAVACRGAQEASLPPIFLSCLSLSPGSTGLPIVDFGTGRAGYGASSDVEKNAGALREEDKAADDDLLAALATRPIMMCYVKPAALCFECGNFRMCIFLQYS